MRRNSVPIRLPSAPTYSADKPRHKPMPTTGFVPKHSQYNSPLALYAEYEGMTWNRHIRENTMEISSATDIDKDDG